MNIKKTDYKYVFGILLSVAISLYIRTLPKAGVFLSNGFLRFGGNDPWYHLRNIQYIVSNYPHVLKWDHFTNYPSGTHQVFAQGYDFLIATICFIFGLGQYDQNIINSVCAYSPAVIGALCVIPVFVIAWKLTDNKNVGLLACFLIAIIPGQFLSRSMIGFNDHHAMEVFITTVTCMFFLLSLKTKDIKYYVLSGIALTLYFAMWKGALLFALIIGVYVTIQILINHMKGEHDKELLKLTSITFAIPLITLLIIPIPGIYKQMSLQFLFIGLIGLSVMYYAADYLKKYPKYYYPACLFVGMVGVTLFAKFFIPSIYDLILRMSVYLLPNGGSLTIGEASPFFQQFTLYSQFAYIGYFSIVGLLLVFYKSIKSKEYMFMFAWSLMILWAMAQQNRFTYYYAVNACILASVIAVELFNCIGLNKTNINKISNKDAIPLITIGIVLFSLIVPTWGITEQYTKGTGGINGQWLESMEWMRYNTPDPGNDLNSEIASYSNDSYGVMSWWDYGHWITVIGHRMPNANPFQQGIGGRKESIEEENKIGASTFFTAQNEEEANKIMDSLNSKYVVTDIEMATGKFYAMTAWTLDTDGYYKTMWNGQTLPSERYYNSMEAKLHLFDGSGLEHYKLVHESIAGGSNEIAYKQIYNYAYGGNVPEIDTGYVKIFEYVEGIEVSGISIPDSEIEVYKEIATNTGRKFIYSQKTFTNSNGNFTVTVPYEGEYNIKVIS